MALMRLKYVILILSILSLTACSHKEPRPSGDGTLRVSIGVSPSSSRVSVAEDGSALWKMSDRLAIWSDADGSSPYVFTAKSVNGQKAAFEGVVEDHPERRSIYAIFPYGPYGSDASLHRASAAVADYENSWDPRSVSISIPPVRESGTSYVLMAGKGPVSGNDFSGCTVYMNHLSCVWDFTLKNTYGRKVSSVTLKTSSNLFPCSADIDLTSSSPADMTVTQWSDKLTLVFPEGDASATVNARFFLLPLEARAVDSFTIEVEYAGGDSESFVRSWPGSGTQAGKKYTTSLTLGAGKPSGSKSRGIPSLDEMVIYSASPRSFASAASLDAIRARLDDIKALGCNVIWLLPIYDGSIVRAPYGSPYSNKDLYAVGSEYGSMSSLMTLVGTAHDKGISVILDFITRHTGADCEWLSTHPSWYAEAYAPDCKDAALFNWPSAYAELRPAFLDLMKFWIDNANVDGFRCDSAVPAEESTGIRTSDWTWIISQLRDSYPDRSLLLLAEAAPASTLSAGFDLNYGWHFCDALEEVFAGAKPSSLLFSTNTEEMESAAAAGFGKARMRYSTNHDKSAAASPLQTYQSRDGAMAAAVLAWTLGGVPMIYGSQEIAYPTKVSFFKTAAPLMDWTANPQTREECRKLLALSRRASIRKGTTTQLCASAIVGYLRSYGGEDVLVLVNVTGSPAAIPLNSEYMSATYTDLYTGEPFTFSGNTMSAYQYLILKR